VLELVGFGNARFSHHPDWNLAGRYLIAQRKYHFAAPANSISCHKSKRVLKSRSPFFKLWRACLQTNPDAPPEKAEEIVAEAYPLQPRKPKVDDEAMGSLIA
jgi:hypothetical protein